MPRPESWQEKKTTVLNLSFFAFLSGNSSNTTVVLSFLLKTIDQLGESLFFFSEILFQAGFSLLGSHFLGFGKLNLDCFVDSEWQKASNITGGGGRFINEKHASCIRYEGERSISMTFTLELY